MEIDKVLALVLPGLRGTIGIGLSDHQLGALLEEILPGETTYVNSVKSHNGYLELRVQLPLLGEKSINVEIDSIVVKSSKLLVSLKLLNISRPLVKGLVWILGKYGIECEMKVDNLALDFTDYWKDTVSELPKDAKAKLNSVKIDVAFAVDKADVTLKIA